MNKLNTLSYKILFLLFISGICSLTCFGLFRYHASDYFAFLRKSDIIDFDNKEFIKSFRKKARHINLYDKDKKDVKALLNDHDAYTTVAIYDEDNQFYMQGKDPSFLKEENENPIPLISQSFVTLQRDFEQETYDLASYEPVTFKDGKAHIMVVDFHTVNYSNFYFIFAILVSILIFLLPTLLFIRKKVQYIHALKDDLSIIAQGNLDVPIHIQGKDELSILAKEIDSLRITLDENIQKELEARKANKELITTLSHDLRTPLTSLRGYLDILSLKKYQNEDQFNKYLTNCIDKVEQIKELSNKTFEYALVFENQDTFITSEINSYQLQDYIENQIEFLKLQGFSVQEEIRFIENSVKINFIMMKRMLNNLFSNILKYADPHGNVAISVECKSNHLKIRMANTIKEDTSHIESNQIGLKSVKKGVELHNGTFYYQKNISTFLVVLNIPC